MSRKRVCLALLALAAAAAWPGLGQTNQTVPLDVDVSLSCVVEMGSLTALPATAPRCGDVTFSFNLTNGQGNVLYTASPYVQIRNSGGGLVDNETGAPTDVNRGDSAAVNIVWNAATNPEGTYTASAYTDATAAALCASVGPRNATFNISGSSCSTPPPTGGGGGGGGGAAPAPAPALAPAQEGVTVEGLPWALQTDLEAFRLAPGQRALVPVSFLVPPDAPAGDNWLVLRMGGASFRSVPVLVEAQPGANVLIPLLAEGRGVATETAPPDVGLVLLRTRPATPGRPTVLRGIELDRDAGVTKVALEVKNGPQAVPRLEVVEEIPKSLASDASQVKFTTPAQVLRADPLVRFVFRDVQPNEARTIRYEVSKILDELTPYVYFPVKQVNVFTTVTPLRLELLTPRVGPLSPGVRSEAVLPVQNREAYPVEATVQVETPAGWAVEPATLAQTLPPGAGELKFGVLPPRGAAGQALLTFRVEAKGQEFLTQSVVRLQEAPWTLVAALAAAGGVGALLVQRRVVVVRRRERERAVRLIEFQQRMRR